MKISPKKLLLVLLFLVEKTVFCAPPSAEWEEWTSQQISAEFLPYETEGITQEMLEQTIAWNQAWNGIAFPSPHEGMYRYRVVDSRIYQTAHYPWRTYYGNSASKVLEKIVKQYPLPDIDFIFLEYDSPPFKNGPLFIAPDHSTPKGPILVGSKGADDRNLILYHDYLTLNFVEDPQYDTFPKRAFNLHYDWTHLSKSLLEEKLPPWELRSNQLFWRGRITDRPLATLDSSSPRLYLCQLSEKNKELIDASTQEANLSEHLLYKYQIALDGSTAPYAGYLWRLLSFSLVFKQKSSSYQWFEAGLIPYVHYIPVESDLSDLLERIRWAKNCDEQAQQIAANGRRFILESALPEHCVRYAYKTLLKYASLQRFQVQVPTKLITKPISDAEYDQTIYGIMGQLHRLHIPPSQELTSFDLFHYDPFVYELIADPLTEEEKVERRKTLKAMGF